MYKVSIELTSNLPAVQLTGMFAEYEFSIRNLHLQKMEVWYSLSIKLLTIFCFVFFYLQYSFYVQFMKLYIPYWRYIIYSWTVSFLVLWWLTFCVL